MFHFSHIQETKKRQAAEFLIKKKISSLIAACSFLYVRFLYRIHTKVKLKLKWV